MCIVDETISAILPLKISGRHYAENLNRCDLLFGTLRHFHLARVFSEIIVVVPGDELELIGRHAQAWSDLPISILAEESFLSVFQQYNKVHQVRPWHRQQIIKLFGANLVKTPFYLTLDPDVLALRQFSYRDLVVGGRALLEPEARSVHADWWHASASLLGVDARLERPGMSVTPALLSRDICLALMERLAARHGTDWFRVLLQNYAINWTEYTLYFLMAESSGLLHLLHRVPEPGAPRLLASYQIWSKSDFDEARLASLFATPQRDFFSVIQSNTGVSATEIASLIRPYLDVNLRPGTTMAAEPGAKSRELAGAAIRKVIGSLRRFG